MSTTTEKLEVRSGVPVTCQTCRHMTTHKACGTVGADDYCLGDFNTRDKVLYRNWEPGNWARDRLEAEQAGTYNIVIGGVGEAEVNTQWTLAYTLKHLHHVAECCGYFVQKRKNRPEIEVYTESRYLLIFGAYGRLQRIDELDQEGQIRNESWPCADDVNLMDKLWEKKS